MTGPNGRLRDDAREDPEALPGESLECEPEEQPRTAEQLVRMALERYRFGRTDKDEPFAVLRDGPNVAVMLKGSADALRAKLAREYRQQFGRTPGASALADALNVLHGEALDAEPEPVFLRLAPHEDGVVIDLGDASGRAVIVHANGWKIAERSPVLFRRTALTGMLPVPERGGQLDELRELLNVTDESWPAIVGWLVAAFLPDIPHAVLLLSGLQGTGKSSAARLLVLLVDPSAAPLRSEPRNLDQWQIAASGSWVVVVDNLSSIPGWLSDAICRAATGDGLVKRKLYSDSDLAVLSFRRVVALTSIDAGALRGDLGERLLLIDLEPIPEAARRTEREIDELFSEKLPRLFGACLDALAAVLAQLPEVRPQQLPRMADFGRVLAAADAAGITSGALDRIRNQQNRIAAEVIDADSFGTALAELARQRTRWQGTATELLEALLPNGEKPPHDWPKRNGVAGRIKRLAPALESQGVKAHVPKERSSKGRIITLEISGDGSSLPSLTSPAIGQLPGDAREDGDDVSRHVSTVAKDDHPWEEQAGDPVPGPPSATSVEPTSNPRLWDLSDEPEPTKVCPFCEGQRFRPSTCGKYQVCETCHPLPRPDCRRVG
jgi:hypothetical protein